MKNEHALPETVENGFGRASAAFPLWAGWSIQKRKVFFKKLRALIVERQEELASILAEETGQPIAEAVSQEITAALEMIRFMEKAYPRWLKGKKFRYWRPGFWTKSNRIGYEPLGLIAVIGPSNFPFSLPVMQACAALLCGNCVMIKPSERCPRTAEFLRRLFKDARFPEGVIGVVDGDAKTVEEIISAESVRKIIFTGSYETGKAIAERCGRFFKPCLLELGGTGAAIIDDKADLDLAARGIAWSAFYSAGLSCIGTKRVFVTPRTSRAFVQKLIEETRTIKTGSPTDPNTDMGILRDPAGMDRMEELVRDAVRKGATAWTPEGDFCDGSFQTLKGPTILFPVTRQMRILSPEIEIPGPLLCVQEVESMDQAVAAANQSKFGLGASVWSRDLRKAQNIARQLQAGMVWINDSSVGLPRFPWGGTKRSGWGRLFSKEAITELTELKVISRDRRLTSSRKFWWYPYSRTKYEMTLCLNEFLYGPRKRKAFLNFLKESLTLIFH